MSDIKRPSTIVLISFVSCATLDVSHTLQPSIDITHRPFKNRAKLSGKVRERYNLAAEWTTKSQDSHRSELGLVCLYDGIDEMCGANIDRQDL